MPAWAVFSCVLWKSGKCETRSLSINVPSRTSSVIIRNWEEQRVRQIRNKEKVEQILIGLRARVILYWRAESIN
jgi:hypothetical protein